MAEQKGKRGINCSKSKPKKKTTTEEKKKEERLSRGGERKRRGGPSPRRGERQNIFWPGRGGREKGKVL